MKTTTTQVRVRNDRRLDAIEDSLAKLADAISEISELAHAKPKQRAKQIETRAKSAKTKTSSAKTREHLAERAETWFENYYRQYAKTRELKCPKRVPEFSLVECEFKSGKTPCAKLVLNGREWLVTPMVSKSNPEFARGFPADRCVAYE
jgi:recombinational DNA repair ATPase RecF